METTLAVSEPSILQGAELHRLVPHDGAMRLLARVLRVEEASIVCEADSHLSGDNPLRSHGRLPITAGIEYAAQAAAIHASLTGDEAEPGRGGSLAVLSNIAWRVDRLDDLDGPLRVRATRIARTGAALQYEFALETVAGAVLIDGVLMIALA